METGFGWFSDLASVRARKGTNVLGGRLDCCSDSPTVEGLFGEVRAREIAVFKARKGTYVGGRLDSCSDWPTLFGEIPATEAAVSKMSRGRDGVEGSLTVFGQ